MELFELISDDGTHKFGRIPALRPVELGHKNEKFEWLFRIKFEYIEFELESP
jgi:hypothetical protein